MTMAMMVLKMVALKMLFFLIPKKANLFLKRVQLTQLKIESQLEMISTHFYLRNMPDGRSFIALLSIQHYIKDGYVEYVPNMENLAENGALNKCIGESNKNL